MDLHFPVIEEMILGQGTDDLRLVRVTTDEQTRIEYEIRRKVFVTEQHVDPDIEYDEFEKRSIHFLLYKNERPIGCSRYRWSGNRIKLERYAVLEKERGNGYGRFIMDRMLEMVLPLKPSMIYLHSQTIAQVFYQKCGFITCGEIFSEADIDHIKMYYPIPK